MGWLEKEPLSDQYINWIGDIYKGYVVEKKWRDYFFWQPYEDKQIDKLVEVCNNLFEEMKIENNFVGHNTKINGIESLNPEEETNNEEEQEIIDNVNEAVEAIQEEKEDYIENNPEEYEKEPIPEETREEIVEDIEGNNKVPEKIAEKEEEIAEEIEKEFDDGEDEILDIF